MHVWGFGNDWKSNVSKGLIIVAKLATITCAYFTPNLLWLITQHVAHTEHTCRVAIIVTQPDKNNNIIIVENN